MVLRGTRKSGRVTLKRSWRGPIPQATCKVSQLPSFMDTTMVSNKLSLTVKRRAIRPMNAINSVSHLLSLRIVRLKELAEHPDHGIPDELVAFNYIYGVLYCPAYRDTYAEFLKIDFPRIPWPATPEEFWSVAEKGGQLRKLHLMDPALIGASPYSFTGEGDNVVDHSYFESGKVWINDTQHFANTPEESWGFDIGGYRPAQKWLKDRKGRELSYSEVQHYQRVLKVLAETDRIMSTIQMTL